MDFRYQIARSIKENFPINIIPWQVDLDFTNTCNQNCFYCNSEEFRRARPKNQPIDRYFNLLEQFTEWHTHAYTQGRLNNIILSGGGEPTLYPEYELLVERALDYGFKMAMNTNGVNLDKMLSIPVEKLKGFSYIGLDIDSGIEETYTKIRRPNNPTVPHFSNVKRVAKEFGRLKLNLDIKALLMPENTSPQELEALFQFAYDTNARKLHLRPLVMDYGLFEITNEIKECIEYMSKKYQRHYTLSAQRAEPRKYTKCHQFFLAPSFCSDGNIYLCCEYKGNPEFSIGSWVDHDWTFYTWCNEKHIELYKKFTVEKCKPCRPNPTNNMIQDYLDNKIENFYI